MTQQHTKGPWVAEWTSRKTQGGYTTPKTGWHIFNEEDVDTSGVIATLEDRWSSDYKDGDITESEANARLIAASPDMFEALEISQAAFTGDLSALEKYGFNLLGDETAHEFAARKRKAAIAKARGQS